MSQPTSLPRPTLAVAYGVFLVVSASFMAALGWSASAYYVPAACLLLQAVLLWTGRGLRCLQGTLLVNQASGLLLVVVLASGDVLGDRKLDLSGIFLLANLLTGGPLASLGGGPLLFGLGRGKSLHRWFQRTMA